MNPLTISTLTSHIASLIQGDELLRDVWLIGEVSNWSRARSGHIYFSLKDGGACLAAVMWKGNVFRHSWLPVEGDQVLAHGYVDVYPDRGVYQFYAEEIRPAGQGQLYARFEMLKRTLAAEGLFDVERKRPIPPLPRRIGVVTSAGAAALRDVLRVLSQRWPLVEVTLFPTLVQGGEAPSQIVAALAAANRRGREGSLFDGDPLDTLLLVRGGGSIEDLWAFNDEAVARAVAASETPVIAGVGHETDFTIVDFVADLRTPTPSAAAAAAVPDRREIIERLRQVEGELARAADEQIIFLDQRLADSRRRLQRADPGRQLDRLRQRLDEGQDRLHRAMSRYLGRRRERMAAARLHLQALSPRDVLARGYSIVQREDGAVVSGADQAPLDADLLVRTGRGDYTVRRVG